MRLHRLLGTLIPVLTGLLTLTSSFAATAVQWSSDFPPIPDAHGFAGPFAGVVGEGDDRWLLFGGGANFPQGAPWEKDAEGNKSPKVWHNSLFAAPLKAGKLQIKDKAEWSKLPQTLPEKLGYGASITLPDRKTALFIGGNRPEAGGTHHSSSVYEVSRDKKSFQFSKVAGLPVGLSAQGSAVIGSRVYIFSGTSSEGDQQAAWVMDTANKDNSKWSWKPMPWPESAPGVKARPRQHPTLGVQGGKLYVFAGRTPIIEAIETPEVDRNRMHNVDFLRDCYAYTPSKKVAAAGRWKRIADLPVGLSAAPQSAVPAGVSHLLMLGGVNVDFLRQQKKDRPNLNGQGDHHPGFPAIIRTYHTITNTWTEAGELPRGSEDDRRANNREVSYAPVTVPVVISGSEFLVPSGEVKPGIRSSQVLAGTIKANRSPFGLINWIVVTVYLMGMVGIGYWFMKREAANTTDDYFRGGQRIPWWVAGLSIFATILSSITFMAIPAVAYSDDWNRWIGQWPILILVPLVVFFYLPFFRKLNLTSAYEYLEARFNLAIRLIASTSFMIFHIGRIAIVLYLPALALSSVTDINIYVAIIVIGVLCVIYTVMGGIEAVVWTDAIQALVLIGGALLCFGLVVAKVDGGFGAITAAADEGKFLTAQWSFEAAKDFSSGTQSGWLFFFGFLFAALPSYTSGQDVVQRYVTTPSEKEAAKSLWLNIFMTLVGSAIFFGLGTALYVFYQHNPGMLDPTMKSNDGILPFYIMQNLPVGVAGLIIAGVFAAAQSTISSSLNSVATAFVTDFYGRVIAPESSDSKRLSVARNIVVILGVTGIACACYVSVANMKSAFDTFNMFVGFVMGPLAAIFALGIFTKRVSGAAALIAAAAGAIALGAVQITNNLEITNIWGLFNGLICFVVTFSVGLIFAIFLPANPEQVKGLNIHSK